MNNVIARCSAIQLMAINDIYNDHELPDAQQLAMNNVITMNNVIAGCSVIQFNNGIYSELRS